MRIYVIGELFCADPGRTVARSITGLVTASCLGRIGPAEASDPTFRSVDRSQTALNGRRGMPLMLVSATWVSRRPGSGLWFLSYRRVTRVKLCAIYNSICQLGVTLKSRFREESARLDDQHVKYSVCCRHARRTPQLRFHL